MATGGRRVTAAARHLFEVRVVESATREDVFGCPIGPDLLDALGELNKDVRAALAGERARLDRDGYPEDLPLPALWWAPAGAGPRASRLTLATSRP
jgi:hypothetical protein